MPTAGEHIKFQSASGRYHEGRITHVVSGSTCHLVLLSDGATWPDFGSGTTSADVPSMVLYSKAQGTSVGEWQYSDSFATEVEAIDDDSSYATAGDISTAVTGLAATSYVDSGDAGRCAVPGAGAHPSLVIGTARQPSTTRPVRVAVSGTWTASLSVTGSASGAIELRSDSSSTPTTVQADAQPGFSATLIIGVTVGQTVPWSLTYDVPAGHYYVVAVASGSGFAITKATEQVQ